MNATEKLHQDFELNLAPIIDCFTVLIAFVMISTAFASIGILDAGIVAGGNQAAATAPAAIRARVELEKGGTMKLRLSGQEPQELGVPAAAGGKRDDAALLARLQEWKTRFPALSQITLQAEDEIPYQDVVGTLETVRKTFPTVALGGF